MPILIAMILLSVVATWYSLTTKSRDRPLVFLGIVTIPYEIFAIGAIIASGDAISFPLSEFLNINAVGYAAELVSIVYAITSISLFYLWSCTR